MHYIEKTIEIAGAHYLDLNYDSKCKGVHGHNWIIVIYCKNHTLNNNGMVIDFTEIKKEVNKLDHSCINDSVKQPTAERIAEYLCKNILFCYKVKVQESLGNIAIYEAL